MTPAAVQVGRLAGLPGPRFEDALARAGRHGLAPAALEYFQINVGKLCNMTCAHCHVDAGPHRREVMTRETMQACLRALEKTPAHTVDLTGGAPELNPDFRWLVEQCRARGRKVIDRCNLTVLLTPAGRGLAPWLAEREVEVVASLPHWRRRNTDFQRGDGTFGRSLTALRELNAARYGKGDPRRRLTLMCNPVGAFLAPEQQGTEALWKRGLQDEHGVPFDRLITLNNMPISRFLDWLEASGNLDAYMTLLANAFNPATVDGLMYRNTVSVGWDGREFRVSDFDPAAFAARRIVVGRHCYGCTAGAGSSCGGAVA